MANKIHSIDFEYNKQGNEFLHLVCVSLDNEVYWLHGENNDTNKFIDKMKELEGEIFLAHAASLAEIPCCIKLNIPVEKYTWICTETMYKYINHLKQGTQTSDISTNLVECLKHYGLSEGFTTTEEKDHWRNIILNHDVEQYKMDIIRYCKSDTTNLSALWLKEREEILELTSGETINAEFEPGYRVIYQGAPCFDKGKAFNLVEFVKMESENHIAVAKMYCESYDADPYLITHLQDWRYMDELKKEVNKIIPGLFDETRT